MYFYIKKCDAFEPYPSLYYTYLILTSDNASVITTASNCLSGLGFCFDPPKVSADSCIVTFGFDGWTVVLLITLDDAGTGEWFESNECVSE